MAVSLAGPTGGQISPGSQTPPKPLTRLPSGSLLQRDELPAELLEALQPMITFYEREQAEPDRDVE